MVKLAFTMLGPSILAVLLMSYFTLGTDALELSVNFVDCTELNWTASLSQTEWSVASYVELFFVSTQRASNYSSLYSALNDGAFPTPGAFTIVTYFGDIALGGQYTIGIGLAGMNGNILTMTSDNSQGTVQVTEVDSRKFTFGDCTNIPSSTSATIAASSTSDGLAFSTASSASLTLTSSAATFALLSASASATATAASSAPPIGSLSSTSLFPPTHNSVNKGIIIGGIIGGLVFLLFAFVLIRWCSSRRRTRRLSQAAHPMLSLRSPSFPRKQARPPEKNGNGSVSPDSHLRRKAAKVYAQGGGTYEVATLGRLSVESGRRSEGYTTRSDRPNAHEDELSLSNMLAEGPSEQKLKVIKVPFHLTPGKAATPAHESMTIDSSVFSATPYLPLDRTSDHHSRSLSTDGKVPSYPSGKNASHFRSKSSHLVLNMTVPGGILQMSPTGSNVPPQRTMRSSNSNSNFKIPRVTVPAYLPGAGEIGTAGKGR